MLLDQGAEDAAVLLGFVCPLQGIRTVKVIGFDADQYLCAEFAGGAFGNRQESGDLGVRRTFVAFGNVRGNG